MFYIPKPKILMPLLQMPVLRGAMKFICFVATPALVLQLMSAGLPITSHPLHSDRFLVPYERVSELTLKDLIKRHDFIFLATVSFLTTPTGSNQTLVSDATWNNASNTVECVGAGGGGGSIDKLSPNATVVGGGGGAYSLISGFNFATPGTTSTTWQTGIGGTTSAATLNTNTSGLAGGDTWFGGTTLAGSSVGAKGGVGGVSSINTSLTGSAGGDKASGVGTTKNSGGRGGTITAAALSATGGGGAAGSHGDGSNGVDTAAAAATAGGQGDVTSGGAGGAASTTSGVNHPGIAGLNLGDLTKGSGGGGGGTKLAVNSAQTAGAGGSFGGGGGACNNASSGTSSSALAGPGAAGLIVLTWTPAGGGGAGLFMQVSLEGISSGGPFFFNDLDGI